MTSHFASKARHNLVNALEVRPSSSSGRSWAKGMLLIWVMVWEISFGGPALAHADPALDAWLSAHVAHSTQVMMSNIGPSVVLPQADHGAVVASPSLDPDYRYHWIRDGALTMDTVLDLYFRTSSSTESARYFSTLLAYIDFSRRNQLTANRSGAADDRGLGEPKFNLDGTAYNADWARPQNDGPALRASTLIRFAQSLLAQGRADLVREKLYAPGLPARTVIKSDLEYVSHHWRETSNDLWEEVQGLHFYTQMVQRRALLDGADLADRLGDASAAQWYRGQGHSLEAEISRHWDEGKGLILATLDRDGGLSSKASGLDVAVVLGAIHGAPRGTSLADHRRDAFFAVHSDRMLQTAQKIEAAFHRLYGINARERDGDNQLLGAAIGRYPEDNYSGGSAQLGNPWFLATSAFAEFYYRVADELSREGAFSVNAINAEFFGALPGASTNGIKAGNRIQSGRGHGFEAVLQSLREKGDSYLRRVKFHADAKGALSEQFNRDSGYMQSAAELTWSHASILTASWAREAARKR